MYCASHSFGHEERRFLQSVRNGLDRKTRLRLLLLEQVCKLEQPGDTTRVVIRARLMSVDVIVGANDQTRVRLVSVPGDDVRIGASVDFEALTSRSQPSLLELRLDVGRDGIEAFQGGRDSWPLRRPRETRRARRSRTVSTEMSVGGGNEPTTGAINTQTSAGMATSSKTRTPIAIRRKDMLN